MKNHIALATQNGYARFEKGIVQYKEEAKEASIFSDRHQATDAAAKHGLTDGYIMVDVSDELKRALAAA